MNTALISALREDHSYDVPDNMIGRVSNDLLFYSFQVQAVFSMMAGYFFDLFGRRITVFLAVMSAAALAATLPLTTPDVWKLTIVRACLGVAFGTLMSHPFTNDYVKKKNRGQAVAIMSTGVVFGELLTFGFMLKITNSMTFSGRFETFALSLVVLAFIFLLLVKNPPHQEKKDTPLLANEEADLSGVSPVDTKKKKSVC